MMVLDSSGTRADIFFSFSVIFFSSLHSIASDTLTRIPPTSGIISPANLSASEAFVAPSILYLPSEILA